MHPASPPTAANPFAEAYTTYLDAGWMPIALPAGQKYPPPDGVTGDRGTAPTKTQLTEWAQGQHNIGVRLGADVIGIDVDTYADKIGATSLVELETAHGPLPPTWCSTARGDDDGPGPSRIAFYRVPVGTRLRANPAPSIEAIQHHHRYAVAWPSINPKTGTTYRWYDPSGEPADGPPPVDELTDLPHRWIEGLRSVGGGGGAEAASPEEVRDFLAAHTLAERTTALDGINTRLANRPAGTSRHDTLIEVACWAMREAAAGCFPARVAVDELRSWWIDVIGTDRRRIDGPEFGDAIAWAIAQTPAAAERIQEIRDRPRTDDPASLLAPSLRNAAPTVPAASAPTPATAEPAALRPLIDSVELPPWPVHTLPPWVRDHVVATASRLQVPVDLCAQLALGTLASVTMGHATIAVGSWTETTNLYTYVAMHSGAGKSPAEKAIVGPLRTWEQHQREASTDEHRIELAKWKVAQRKLRKDEEGAAIGSVSTTELAASVIAASGDRPVPYRLTVDDATPERLVQLLAQHKRLALISTEAGLLDMVGAQSRNGATNIDVYLKAWSGETIQRDRKGGDDGPETTFVTGALLSVVLTIQPSVVEKYQATSPELRGRGFFARFMPSVPKSLVGTRTYGDLEQPGPEADTYATELVALADTMNSTSVELHLTPDDEARAMFYRWCEAMERQLTPGGRLAALHDASSKIRSSVLRAAAVLSLAAGEWRTVSAATMADAIAIGDYWTEHARFVEGAVDPLDTDNAHAVEMALAIVDWCRRRGTLDVTPRDVFLSRRRGLSLRGAEDLAPGFEHLEARGWLTFTEGGVASIGVPRTVVCARLRADALTHFTGSVQDNTPSELPRAMRADCLIGEKPTSSSYTHVKGPPPPGPPQSARIARGNDEGPVDNPTPARPPVSTDWI